MKLELVQHDLRVAVEEYAERRGYVIAAGHNRVEFAVDAQGDHVLIEAHVEVVPPNPATPPEEPHG